MTVGLNGQEHKDHRNTRLLWEISQLPASTWVWKAMKKLVVKGEVTSSCLSPTQVRDPTRVMFNLRVDPHYYSTR